MYSGSDNSVGAAIHCARNALASQRDTMPTLDETAQTSGYVAIQPDQEVLSELVLQPERH